MNIEDEHSFVTDLILAALLVLAVGAMCILVTWGDARFNNRHLTHEVAIEEAME